MKASRFAFVPLLLCAQIMGIAQPGLADEQLYQLCSKFPLNSRCKNYTTPISLDKRPGLTSKCRRSITDKYQSCKIHASESQLTIFMEHGKSLSVLEDKKNTRKITIPVTSIQSMSYSENSKTDVGAVVALGLPGLLVKVKRSIMQFEYQPNPDASLETAPPLPKTMMVKTKRNQGVQLRSQLERVNGKPMRTVLD